MMTVEIQRGDSLTTVMADQIQAVVVDHTKQTAFVQLRNGVSYACDNPGAVRDAWVKWTARQRRRVDADQPRSLFDLIFGK